MNYPSSGKKHALRSEEKNKLIRDVEGWLEEQGW